MPTKTHSRLQPFSKLCKPRLPLFHPCLHRLHHILRLQRYRVPNTRIPQPILHAPAPAPIQQLLRALHRNGTLRRHHLRYRQRFANYLVFPTRLAHPAHEAYRFSFGGSEYAGSQADVFDPATVPDDFGETRKCTYVGGETNIHLLYREFGVFCAYAHVSADGDVNP